MTDFLEVGGNANNTKFDGKPLLHVAIENQSPTCVQLLLNNGASLNIEADETNKKPMDVFKDQEALIPKDHPQYRALQETREVFKKHEILIQNLVNAYKASQHRMKTTGKPGETEDSVKAVRELVEQGYNINALMPPYTNNIGGSLVHFVISASWPDSFSYLLTKNPDLKTVQNNEGHNPPEMVQALRRLFPDDPGVKKILNAMQTQSIKFVGTINSLNSHLPKDKEGITEEPAQSTAWIKNLTEVYGEDILRRTNIGGLKRTESLYECMALAGWARATDFILKLDIDPKMKTSNGKTVMGLLDKKLGQYPDNKSLKETRKVISNAIDKNNALAKAKVQVEASLQRIEKGEPSETDDLVKAIQGYVKLSRNVDSFIEGKTFLHMAAEYGWPRTAKMLMEEGLDPRALTREEEERTAFQISEESIQKAQELPKDNPNRAGRLQELTNTRDIICKDKALWDACTELEDTMSALEERRDNKQYGDTPRSKQAIQQFIAVGGDVNKINYFFPVIGSLLHSASIYCLRDSIPAILKAGGNINNVDLEGETPVKINSDLQAVLKNEAAQQSPDKYKSALALRLAKAVDGQFKQEQERIQAEKDASKKKPAKRTEQPSTLSAPVTEPSTSGNKSTNKSKQRPNPKPGKPKGAKEASSSTSQDTQPKPPVSTYDKEAAARQSQEALEKKWEADRRRQEEKQMKQRASEEAAALKKREKLDKQKQTAQQEPSLPVSSNTASTSANPFQLSTEQELSKLFTEDSPQSGEKISTMLPGGAQPGYEALQSRSDLFAKAFATAKSNRAFYDSSARWNQDFSATQEDIEEILLSSDDTRPIEARVLEYCKRHKLDPTKLLESVSKTEDLPEWA